MFRIFDYTGATALFGEEFITPPPSSGGDEPPPGPPPLKVKGMKIDIEHVGNFQFAGRGWPNATCHAAGISTTIDR